MKHNNARLRSDVPNEILELLLFEGGPQGRSRQELEERYNEVIDIPYISRWLGTSSKHLGHTDEPWEIWGTPGEIDLSIGPTDGGVAVAQIVTANGIGIATNEAIERGTANAKRIVAAVNFCAGIETDVLEVCLYQSTKRDFMRQRDELLAVAELILKSFAYAPGKGPEWYEAARRAVTTYRGHLDVHAANQTSEKADVYAGHLKFPGTERIEVEFECRQGATDAEKDQAFINALSQIGTVDYLSIGEK